MDDLTPTEEAYAARLFSHILTEVIGLDETAGGGSGYVRPDIVRMVLADVAATIDFNCGLGKVPRERRQTGEEMGKAYAAKLRGLIEAEEAGADFMGWPKGSPVSEH